ncbi:MAG: DNA-binding response regulator [Rubrivivax sp. SCN 71-131]|jgi:DNA-binding NarL/FixJ family response regulator|nr:MAG: DNA-binding response regulator [Rubrivivax sp. SCN 71-131]
MTRVYLLDDHALVREGLRAVLESAGMVVVGESGEVGPALAEIVARVPDVVLLDLSLPDRSGLDLLAQLGDRGLPTRILVLTASERPRHVAEAVRLGAAGYLLKGAPAEEVVKAIREVLGGRRHFGEGVAEGATESGDPIATLSARERQIMRMVVAGMSSAAIALELHLSPKTVDTYRSRLMAKLGVHDLANLVRVAVRLGVIDADKL